MECKKRRKNLVSREHITKVQPNQLCMELSTYGTEGEGMELSE